MNLNTNPTDGNFGRLQQRRFLYPRDPGASRFVPFEACNMIAAIELHRMTRVPFSDGTIVTQRGQSGAVLGAGCVWSTEAPGRAGLRDRWQIEVFFRALKQNLRVKTFVGTSANAVRIQIWTALIAMLKYLQLRSCFAWSLSNLVALLRSNYLCIGIFGPGSTRRFSHPRSRAG